MGLPILVYHRVARKADPSVARYAVRPGAFQRQMWLLHRAGWQTIGPDALALARNGGPRLPRRAVWLTFDDGYIDFAETAAPIMRRYGHTATLYVPGAYVGKSAGWLTGLGLGDGDVPILDWDGLRRLHRMGFTIGAHSLTHQRLPELSDAELTAELTGGRELLEEKLDLSVRHLAYPHGAYDERVVHAAASAGYLTATTCDWGLSTNESLLALRRVFVFRRDSVVDFLLHLRNGGDLGGPLRFRRDQLRRRVRIG